jgi:hypothetical protein
MAKYISAICLLAFGVGCQEAQLREKTLKVVNTTSDLLYDQVLDNVALSIDNPAALPFFDGPTQGTAQVQRNFQASYTAGWDLLAFSASFAGRYLFDKQAAMLQGSQLNNLSWQLTPTDNPDKLILMQCAYRRATGQSTDDCEHVLYEFYHRRHMLNGDFEANKDQKATPPPPPLVNYAAFLQPGWFSVGKKGDVPKCACYVGRHCKTYVWVTPEHFEEFARFTLAILDMYTVSDVLMKATPGGYAVPEYLLPPRNRPYLIAPPPAVLP